MTRMVIGDDLSPHFVDDDGPLIERCELCNKVALDHRYGWVVFGPLGQSTADEEGFTYWGHVSCIAFTEGIDVAEVEAEGNYNYSAPTEDDPDFDYVVDYNEPVEIEKED